METAVEKFDWLRRIPVPAVYEPATKIGAVDLTTNVNTSTSGPAPNTMTGQSPAVNYGVGIGAGALLGLFLVGGPAAVVVGGALGAGAGYLASRPKTPPGKGGAGTGWWVTPGVSYVDARGRAWTFDPLYAATAEAKAGTSRYKRIDGAFLIGPTINPATYDADAAAWAIRFDTSP